MSPERASSDPSSHREPLLAAVLQMNASSDAAGNWRQARDLVARAAAAGARLVATPENTNYLGPHEEKVRLAETLDGPTCERFGGLARQHHLHLLLGSFNERSADPQRCYNTSVLFGPDGSQLAIYRKIHLFDVDLSEQVSFQESRTVVAGEEPVVAATPWLALGLSICYDLRFPELYRRLVDAGAEALAVPSAFTLTTGRAHWYPLLRARAIENQCYVLAPAQQGRHDDRGLRESFGHAMIIDPWGQVLATVGEGPGLALAEIDPARVQRLRRAMPVTDHRRL